MALDAAQEYVLRDSGEGILPGAPPRGRRSLLRPQPGHAPDVGQELVPARLIAVLDGHALAGLPLQAVHDARAGRGRHASIRRASSGVFSIKSAKRSDKTETGMATEPTTILSFCRLF